MHHFLRDGSLEALSFVPLTKGFLIVWHYWIACRILRVGAASNMGKLNGGSQGPVTFFGLHSIFHLDAREELIMCMKEVKTPETAIEDPPSTHTFS